MKQTEHRFTATDSSGEVSAVHVSPADAACLLVFAHGAGAPMRHPFMEAMAQRLAERGVATLRFNFPYTEHRRRRPDHQPILLKTIRSAMAFAATLANGLPIFAGGKSMGGRMTSLAHAKEPLAGVCGLIFFGFPLHAAGRESDDRAQHLTEVGLPMLFLQGTRDKLANLELLRPVCARLGGRAALTVIDGADHGFHVLKRSGRTDEDALNEMADAVRDWCRGFQDR